MSPGQIVLLVVGVIGLLLFAHLVILPLVQRRPVLLRGPEAFVMIVVLSLGLLATVSWMLAPGALIVAGVLMWIRPWWVAGVDRELVMRAAEHAGGMIRFRVRRVDDATLATGKTGRVVVRAGLGVWVRFRAPRTPRLALFQNVLRKSIQNYRLGQSASSTGPAPDRP